MFERNAGGADAWGQVAKLTASDAAPGDEFGDSVSINGATAIVGAFQDDNAGTDSGSAYVFERNEGGADIWGQVAKLGASDAAAGDRFGESVSISGDAIVVGAAGNDAVSSDSGSAYVFGRNAQGADRWGQVAKLTGADTAAGDEFGNSVSISGDTVVIGAFLDDDGGDASGSAYTFTVTGCEWVEVVKPVASDAASGDRFGRSASITGGIVVVGSAESDDAGESSGSAYVLARNAAGGDRWGEVMKLTALDAAAGDMFGISVSADHQMIAVGAVRDSDAGTYSGSAYLFERNTGGADRWGQVAKRTAMDAAAGDEFGRSVSISGDTAVIGADASDDAGESSGSAYVFERNMGGVDKWGQVAKLTALDAEAGDVFGVSVSVSGDTLVVGAHRDKDACPFNIFCVSGSAYVFERNVGGVGKWGQVAKLTGLNVAVTANFGWSVSISGDTIVIGALGDGDANSASGSAYVFERNMGGAGVWGQVAKLTAVDAAPGDLFGESVSISGDTVVVGALEDADAGTASGSAYVFERNARGADTWAQVAKLTAGDAAAGDLFGDSVSTNEDTIVVGASSDDDAGLESGSAFILNLSCPVCGDGLQEPPEECDAGVDNSDVTPDACRTDCTLPRCGDFVQDSGEECDDGNTAGGDGCDAICLLECRDNDGDGFGLPGDSRCANGAAPDCDDANGVVWATPGEVLDADFTSETVMTWAPPADLGGVSVTFDVLRSQSANDFGSTAASCVESNDGSDTSVTDATMPGSGMVSFYLVRAENVCPGVGQGSFGMDSSGAARTGRPCPRCLWSMKVARRWHDSRQS